MVLHVLLINQDNITTHRAQVDTGDNPGSAQELPGVVPPTETGGVVGGAWDRAGGHQDGAGGGCKELPCMAAPSVGHQGTRGGEGRKGGERRGGRIDGGWESKGKMGRNKREWTGERRTVVTMDTGNHLVLNELLHF